MKIFNRHETGRERYFEQVDPVPEKLIPSEPLDTPSQRKVAIVGEIGTMARARMRLLKDGHQASNIFLSPSPEKFMTQFEQGFAPDVILVDGFAPDEDAMTGPQLARSLRLDKHFTGRIYSASDDHGGMAPDSLKLNGFNGNLEHYYLER